MIDEDIEFKGVKFVSEIYIVLNKWVLNSNLSLTGKHLGTRDHLKTLLHALYANLFWLILASVHDVSQTFVSNVSQHFLASNNRQFKLSLL